MTASLDAFRKVAEPNLCRHCDALISMLVFRNQVLGQAPEWVSLSTRIALIPPGLTVSGRTGETVFESGRFRAAKGVVRSSRVSSLLNGYERGVLLADGLPEGWTERIVLAVGQEL